MTELRHEVVIQAPIAAVWDTLADLEAVRHYNPLVAAARYVSKARQGVGATRQCDFKPGGSAREQVTEWEPTTAMSTEAVDHPWPMRSVHWRNELAPQGPATLLKQVLRYEFTGQPEGAAMMESQWNQGVQAVLEGLRAYVESGAR